MTETRPPRGADAPNPEPPRRNPRTLAARVLLVQALTLLALWLLQASFGAG